MDCHDSLHGVVGIEAGCGLLDKKSNVPSARLTLHSTKLCTKSKIFRKKIFVGTKIPSDVFLSISQNLKLTRLQGGTQTKL
jgi:hypothetical protein